MLMDSGRAMAYGYIRTSTLPTRDGTSHDPHIIQAAFSTSSLWVFCWYLIFFLPGTHLVGYPGTLFCGVGKSSHLDY